MYMQKHLKQMWKEIDDLELRALYAAQYVSFKSVVL